MKIERQSWWRLPQQLRFLLAGGYNTLFGYLAFGVLFLLLGRRLHYLVIGILAYIISLVSAFVVYRHLVFRSTDLWHKSFVRFNLSQLFALGFGMAGLYALVEFGHLNPLLAQALVMIASVLLTYVLHRFFSFRARTNEL